MNENTDSNNEVRTATEAQTTGIPQMAEINWADYLDQTQFKDGNSGVITVGDTGPWVIDPNAEIICGDRNSTSYTCSVPIPEDIFGQTHLYSGPHPDRYAKYTQPPLSEPLYECRLGWYYSPSRTTSKRTGQPLKKKPSYRYDRKLKPFPLGSTENLRYYSGVQLLDPLDAILATSREENYVVFIPQELWDQYPNFLSTRPNFGYTPTELKNYNEKIQEELAEFREYSLGKIDFESPVESLENPPVTVSPCTPGNTKPTLWKRFLSWLSLEY